MTSFHLEGTESPTTTKKQIKQFLADTSNNVFCFFPTNNLFTFVPLLLSPTIIILYITLSLHHLPIPRKNLILLSNLIPKNKNQVRNKMATAENAYTLDSVRKALNTETVQAKAGRYENPEENPFFPENLQPLLVPSYPFTKILHSGAASVNINKSLWKMYFDDLLPLFVASGDDGNYAQTAASDLSLLQAISKRVHYGKFVAEVKFRESPQDYEPLIRAKDREGLMKLLTFKSVEEMVKKRVEKKATLFGQEISLDSNDDSKEKKKFDPSVASKLYEKWVIPLTKEVQVDYLLRRLD
ncbi:unnamed protein product [Vicia faba]|uniref:chorismate mutase n=1 Tax=Vicia faba TaxID=3906 RepID=A0AAV1A816_VICFA|nr:unnamed protein product [Vicia faba]